MAKKIKTAEETTALSETSDNLVAFHEVVQLIEKARQQAYQVVNAALVDLYWQVGRYISQKLETAAWGEAIVDELAGYIQRHSPTIQGFTRRNLFRMRQFFEAYRSDEKVAPLVRQLPWTHNLIILTRAKRPEEREFYLRFCIAERWSKRDLERQINGSLFERQVLFPPKVSPLVTQLRGSDSLLFKDSYIVDFLNLPEGYTERDLQHGLIRDLKRFLLELGRDFCFIGEEYLVQVGGRDFRLDLLFFHRELQCLVAFELKVDEFQPEHLGKLSFYLEALDRDVKKPHENPSIGVLLCAGKDSEVVEYALSRTLSPALVAEYQMRLPDKQLLQSKLHEFYLLLNIQD